MGIISMQVFNKPYVLVWSMTIETHSVRLLKMWNSYTSVDDNTCD